MSTPPLLVSVRPAAPSTLELSWNTGETLTANVASLVSRFVLYAPLKSPAVFSLARTDEWGHAVVWPGGIDMGADQLYSLCREQSGEWGPEHFSAWMERNHLSLSDAANALGMTRRMMAHYKTGSRAIPRVVRLACEGWEHLHVA